MTLDRTEKRALLHRQHPRRVGPVCNRNKKVKPENLITDADWLGSRPRYALDARHHSITLMEWQGEERKVCDQCDSGEEEVS